MIAYVLIMLISLLIFLGLISFIEQLYTASHEPPFKRQAK